jgi:hypothetical protein
MSDAEYEVGESSSACLLHSFYGCTHDGSESVTKARVDAKRGKKIIWVSSGQTIVTVCELNLWSK